MAMLTPKRRANQRAKFHRDKFKALVHYICWRCEDPRVLGAVRLNKVLWHAERGQYVRTGQPIAGATYVKQQSGPVAVAVVPVVAELEKEGALASRERSYGGNTTQYFARYEPDISIFTPNEISLIDSAIEVVCFRASPPAGDAAADAEVWRLAQIGERLPYYTVFAARPGEIAKRDMDWALEHVRRGVSEPELKEFEELTRLNPRLDEAYAALEWYLARDPSAGLPVPVSNTSFFLYKQSDNSPLSLPSIAVIYTIDLNELAIFRIRFGFDEEDEDLNEGMEIGDQN